MVSLTNITSGFPFREFILPRDLMKGKAIALANTSLPTTWSVLFRLRLPHVTSLPLFAPIPPSIFVFGGGDQRKGTANAVMCVEQRNYPLNVKLDHL